MGGSLDALVVGIDADGDRVPCEICDDDGDANPGTCADVCLYEEGKSPLGAVLTRAADRTNDAALGALGRQFAVYGVDALGHGPQPLNKETGIGRSRLHAAVARAALGTAPLFADGFESERTAAWSAAVP